MNTNTKKTSPKSSPHPSPNGADMNRRMHNLEIDNAAIKAEKVGWWRGSLAIGFVTATMLSTILGVTIYLDGKIEATRAEQQQIRAEFMTEIAEVKTEIAEVKENQARFDERQIRMEGDLREIKDLLRQNIAQQGGSNITIDEATLRAITDESNGMPTTITTSYVITGEALVVAPGDALGEGENLIIVASHTGDASPPSKLGVDLSNDALYTNPNPQEI
ncbi:MAG: hypothetical protein MJE68_21300 [Proteobacteria bacterium]|nr:hypothetical protein [Pseudomonadota bacterium]